MLPKVSLREFNEFLLDYRRSHSMQHLRLGQAFYNRHLGGVVGNEIADKLHAETNEEVATKMIYDNFVEYQENPVESETNA